MLIEIAMLYVYAIALVIGQNIVKDKTHTRDMGLMASLAFIAALCLSGIAEIFG